MAWVGPNSDKVRIRKGLGDVQPNSFELADLRIFLGHTRFKTTGAATIPNAHPFQFGDIIGAHNGVISNHMALNKEYKREFEVDSMHLFAHLAEGRDFEDLFGYGAIHWVDRKKPGTIYLTRMNNGQLSVFGIGTHAKPDGIVWSSDVNHLIQALRQAGIKKFFPYEVEQGQVYSIHNGDVFIVEDRKLDLSTQQKTTSHLPDYTAYGSYVSDADGDDAWTDVHYNWRDKTSISNKEEAELLEWHAWREYIKTHPAEEIAIVQQLAAEQELSDTTVELGGSG